MQNLTVTIYSLSKVSDSNVCYTCQHIKNNIKLIKISAYSS